MCAKENDKLKFRFLRGIPKYCKIGKLKCGLLSNISNYVSGYYEKFLSIFVY